MLLGLIGATLMLVLAGVSVLAVRIGRRLWARSTGNHTRRHGPKVEIAFYRRFESMMARQGLVRALVQRSTSSRPSPGLGWRR